MSEYEGRLSTASPVSENRSVRGYANDHILQARGIREPHAYDRGEFGYIYRMNYDRFSGVKPRFERAESPTLPRMPTALSSDYFNQYINRPLPKFQSYGETYTAITGRTAPDAVREMDAAVGAPSVGHQINRALGFRFYEENLGLIGSTLISTARFVDTLLGHYELKDDEIESSNKLRGGERKFIAYANAEQSEYSGGLIERITKASYEALQGSTLAVVGYGGVLATQFGFAAITARGLRHLAHRSADKTLMQKAAGGFFMSSLDYEVEKRAAQIAKDQGISAERAMHIAQSERYSKEGLYGTTPTSLRSLPGFINAYRRFEASAVQSLGGSLLNVVIPEKTLPEAQKSLQELVEVIKAPIEYDPRQRTYTNFGTDRIRKVAKHVDLLARHVPGNLFYWLPQVRQVMDISRTTDSIADVYGGSILEPVIDAFTRVTKIGTEIVKRPVESFETVREIYRLTKAVEAREAFVRTGAVLSSEIGAGKSGRDYMSQVMRLNERIKDYTGVQPEVENESRFAKGAGRVLALGAAAIAADYVLDQFVLKTQGADLGQQLKFFTAVQSKDGQVMGVQFNATMPVLASLASAAAGAAIGGYMFPKVSVVNPLADKATKTFYEASLNAKGLDPTGSSRARFNKTAAGVGGLLGLFAVKAGYIVAASVLNSIFNRTPGIPLDGETEVAAGNLLSVLNQTERDARSIYATAGQVADRELLKTLVDQNKTSRDRYDLKGNPIYTVASQFSLGFAQFAMLARTDVRAGVTMYSAGMQILPTLGIGMSPTLSLGLIQRAPDVDNNIRDVMQLQAMGIDPNNGLAPAAAVLANTLGVLNQLPFLEFGYAPGATDTALFGVLGMTAAMRAGAEVVMRKAGDKESTGLIARASRQLMREFDELGFAGKAAKGLFTGAEAFARNTLALPVVMVNTLAKAAGAFAKGTSLENLRDGKVASKLSQTGPLLRQAAPYLATYVLASALTNPYFGVDTVDGDEPSAFSNPITRAMAIGTLTITGSRALNSMGLFDTEADLKTKQSLATKIIPNYERFRNIATDANSSQLRRISGRAGILAGGLLIANVAASVLARAIGSTTGKGGLDAVYGSGVGGALRVLSGVDSSDYDTRPGQSRNFFADVVSDQIKKVPFIGTNLVEALGLYKDNPNMFLPVPGLPYGVSFREDGTARTYTQSASAAADLSYSTYSMFTPGMGVDQKQLLRVIAGANLKGRKDADRVMLAMVRGGPVRSKAMRQSGLTVYETQAVTSGDIARAISRRKYRSDNIGQQRASELLMDLQREALIYGKMPLRDSETTFPYQGLNPFTGLDMMFLPMNGSPQGMGDILELAYTDLIRKNRVVNIPSPFQGVTDLLAAFSSPDASFMTQVVGGGIALTAVGVAAGVTAYSTVNMLASAESYYQGKFLQQLQTDRLETAKTIRSAAMRRRFGVATDITGSYLSVTEADGTTGRIELLDRDKIKTSAALTQKANARFGRMMENYFFQDPSQLKVLHGGKAVNPFQMLLSGDYDRDTVKQLMGSQFRGRLIKELDSKVSGGSTVFDLLVSRNQRGNLDALNFVSQKVTSNLYDEVIDEFENLKATGRYSPAQMVEMTNLKRMELEIDTTKRHFLTSEPYRAATDTIVDEALAGSKYEEVIELKGYQRSALKQETILSGVKAATNKTIGVMANYLFYGKDIYGAAEAASFAFSSNARRRAQGAEQLANIGLTLGAVTLATEAVTKLTNFNPLVSAAIAGGTLLALDLFKDNPVSELIRGTEQVLAKGLGAAINVAGSIGSAVLSPIADFARTSIFAPLGEAIQELYSDPGQSMATAVLLQTFLPTSLYKSAPYRQKRTAYGLEPFIYGDSAGYHRDKNYEGLLSTMSLDEGVGDVVHPFLTGAATGYREKTLMQRYFQLSPDGRLGNSVLSNFTIQAMYPLSQTMRLALERRQSASNFIRYGRAMRRPEQGQHQYLGTLTSKSLANLRNYQNVMGYSSMGDMFKAQKQARFRLSDYRSMVRYDEFLGRSSVAALFDRNVVKPATDLMQSVYRKVEPAVTFARDTATAIIDRAKQAKDIVVSGIVDFKNSVTDLVRPYAKATKTFIKEVYREAKDFVRPYYNQLKAFGGVVRDKAKAGIDYAGDKLNKFRVFMAEALGDAVHYSAEKVSQVAAYGVKAFKKGVGYVKDFVQPLTSLLKRGLDKADVFLGKAFVKAQSGIQSLVSVFKSALEPAAKVAETIMGSAGTTADGAAKPSRLSELYKSAIERLSQYKLKERGMRFLKKAGSVALDYFSPTLDVLTTVRNSMRLDKVNINTVTGYQLEKLYQDIAIDSAATFTAAAMLSRGFSLPSIALGVIASIFAGSAIGSVFSQKDINDENKFLGYSLLAANVLSTAYSVKTTYDLLKTGLFRGDASRVELGPDGRPRMTLNETVSDLYSRGPSRNLFQRVFGLGPSKANILRYQRAEFEVFHEQGHMAQTYGGKSEFEARRSLFDNVNKVRSITPADQVDDVLSRIDRLSQRSAQKLLAENPTLSAKQYQAIYEQELEANVRAYSRQVRKYGQRAAADVLEAVDKTAGRGRFEGLLGNRLGFKDKLGFGAQKIIADLDAEMPAVRYSGTLALKSAIGDRYAQELSFSRKAEAALDLVTTKVGAITSRTTSSILSRVDAATRPLGRHRLGLLSLVIGGLSGLLTPQSKENSSTESAIVGAAFFGGAFYANELLNKTLEAINPLYKSRADYSDLPKNIAALLSDDIRFKKRNRGSRYLSMALVAAAGTALPGKKEPTMALLKYLSGNSTSLEMQNRLRKEVMVRTALTISETLLGPDAESKLVSGRMIGVKQHEFYNYFHESVATIGGYSFEIGEDSRITAYDVYDWSSTRRSALDFPGVINSAMNIVDKGIKVFNKKGLQAILPFYNDSQRLFFVDPEKGRAVFAHSLWGQTLGGTPYLHRAQFSLEESEQIYEMAAEFTNNWLEKSTYRDVFSKPDYESLLLEKNNRTIVIDALSDADVTVMKPINEPDRIIYRAPDAKVVGDLFSSVDIFTSLASGLEATKAYNSGDLETGRVLESSTVTGALVSTLTGVLTRNTFIGVGLGIAASVFENNLGVNKLLGEDREESTVSTGTYLRLSQNFNYATEIAGNYISGALNTESFRRARRKVLKTVLGAPVAIAKETKRLAEIVAPYAGRQLLRLGNAAISLARRGLEVLPTAAQTVGKTAYKGLRTLLDLGGRTATGLAKLTGRLAQGLVKSLPTVVQQVGRGLLSAAKFAARSAPHLLKATYNTARFLGKKGFQLGRAGLDFAGKALRFTGNALGKTARAVPGLVSSALKNFGRLASFVGRNALRLGQFALNTAGGAGRAALTLAKAGLVQGARLSKSAAKGLVKAARYGINQLPALWRFTQSLASQTLRFGQAAANAVYQGVSYLAPRLVKGAGYLGRQLISAVPYALRAAQTVGRLTKTGLRQAYNLVKNIDLQPLVNVAKTTTMFALRQANRLAEYLGFEGKGLVKNLIRDSRKSFLGSPRSRILTEGKLASTVGFAATALDLGQMFNAAFSVGDKSMDSYVHSYGLAAQARASLLGGFLGKPLGPVGELFASVGLQQLLTPDQEDTERSYALQEDGLALTLTQNRNFFREASAAAAAGYGLSKTMGSIFNRLNNPLKRVVRTAGGVGTGVTIGGILGYLGGSVIDSIFGTEIAETSGLIGSGIGAITGGFAGAHYQPNKFVAGRTTARFGQKVATRATSFRGTKTSTKAALRYSRYVKGLPFVSSTLRVFGNAAKVLDLANIGVSAYQLFKAETEEQSEAAKEKLYGSVGQLSGGFSGATIGALIGTFVLGPVGTVLGAAIGGYLGSEANREFNEETGLLGTIGTSALAVAAHKSYKFLTGPSTRFGDSSFNVDLYTQEASIRYGQGIEKLYKKGVRKDVLSQYLYRRFGRGANREFYRAAFEVFHEETHFDQYRRTQTLVESFGENNTISKLSADRSISQHLQDLRKSGISRREQQVLVQKLSQLSLKSTQRVLGTHGSKGLMRTVVDLDGSTRSIVEYGGKDFTRNLLEKVFAGDQSAIADYPELQSKDFTTTYNFKDIYEMEFEANLAAYQRLEREFGRDVALKTLRDISLDKKSLRDKLLEKLPILKRFGYREANAPILGERAQGLGSFKLYTSAGALQPAELEVVSTEPHSAITKVEDHVENKLPAQRTPFKQRIKESSRNVLKRTYQGTRQAILGDVGEDLIQRVVRRTDQYKRFNERFSKTTRSYLNRFLGIEKPSTPTSAVNSTVSPSVSTEVAPTSNSSETLEKATGSSLFKSFGVGGKSNLMAVTLSGLVGLAAGFNKEEGNFQEKIGSGLLLGATFFGAAYASKKLEELYDYVNPLYVGQHNTAGLPADLVKKLKGGDKLRYGNTFMRALTLGALNLYQRQSPEKAEEIQSLIKFLRRDASEVNLTNTRLRKELLLSSVSVVYTTPLGAKVAKSSQGVAQALITDTYLKSLGASLIKEAKDEVEEAAIKKRIFGLFSKSYNTIGGFNLSYDSTDRSLTATDIYNWKRNKKTYFFEGPLTKGFARLEKLANYVTPKKSNKGLFTIPISERSLAGIEEGTSVYGIFDNNIMFGRPSQGALGDFGLVTHDFWLNLGGRNFVQQAKFSKEEVLEVKNFVASLTARDSEFSDSKGYLNMKGLERLEQYLDEEFETAFETRQPTSDIRLLKRTSSMSTFTRILKSYGAYSSIVDSMQVMNLYRSGKLEEARQLELTAFTAASASLAASSLTKSMFLSLGLGVTTTIFARQLGIDKLLGEDRDSQAISSGSLLRLNKDYTYSTNVMASIVQSTLRSRGFKTGRNIALLPLLVPLNIYRVGLAIYTGIKEAGSLATYTMKGAANLQRSALTSIAKAQDFADDVRDTVQNFTQRNETLRRILSSDFMQPQNSPVLQGLARFTRRVSLTAANVRRGLTQFVQSDFFNINQSPTLRTLNRGLLTVSRIAASAAELVQDSLSSNFFNLNRSPVMQGLSYAQIFAERLGAATTRGVAQTIRNLQEFRFGRLVLPPSLFELNRSPVLQLGSYAQMFAEGVGREAARFANNLSLNEFVDIRRSPIVRGLANFAAGTRQAIAGLTNLNRSPILQLASYGQMFIEKGAAEVYRSARSAAQYLSSADFIDVRRSPVVRQLARLGAGAQELVRGLTDFNRSPVLQLATYAGMLYTGLERLGLQATRAFLASEFMNVGRSPIVRSIFRLSSLTSDAAKGLLDLNRSPILQLAAYTGRLYTGLDRLGLQATRALLASKFMDVGSSPLVKGILGLSSLASDAAKGLLNLNRSPILQLGAYAQIFAERASAEAYRFGRRAVNYLGASDFMDVRRSPIARGIFRMGNAALQTIGDLTDLNRSPIMQGLGYVRIFAENLGKSTEAGARRTVQRSLRYAARRSSTVRKLLALELPKIEFDKGFLSGLSDFGRSAASFLGNALPIVTNDVLNYYNENSQVVKFLKAARKPAADFVRAIPGYVGSTVKSASGAVGAYLYDMSIWRKKFDFGDDIHRTVYADSKGLTEGRSLYSIGRGQQMALQNYYAQLYASLYTGGKVPAPDVWQEYMRTPTYTFRDFTLDVVTKPLDLAEKGARVAGKGILALGKGVKIAGSYAVKPFVFAAKATSKFIKDYRAYNARFNYAAEDIRYSYFGSDLIERSTSRGRINRGMYYRASELMLEKRRVAEARQIMLDRYGYDIRNFTDAQIEGVRTYDASGKLNAANDGRIAAASDRYFDDLFYRHDYARKTGVNLLEEYQNIYDNETRYRETGYEKFLKLASIPQRAIFDPLYDAAKPLFTKGWGYEFKMRRRMFDLTDARVARAMEFGVGGLEVTKDGKVRGRDLMFLERKLKRTFDAAAMKYSKPQVNVALRVSDLTKTPAELDGLAGTEAANNQVRDYVDEFFDRTRVYTARDVILDTIDSGIRGVTNVAKGLFSIAVAPLKTVNKLAIGAVKVVSPKTAARMERVAATRRGTLGRRTATMFANSTGGVFSSVGRQLRTSLLLNGKFNTALDFISYGLDTYQMVSAADNVTSGSLEEYKKAYKVAYQGRRSLVGSIGGMPLGPLGELIGGITLSTRTGYNEKKAERSYILGERGAVLTLSMMQGFSREMEAAVGTGYLLAKGLNQGLAPFLERNKAVRRAGTMAVTGYAGYLVGGALGELIGSGVDSVFGTELKDEFKLGGEILGTGAGAAIGYSLGGVGKFARQRQTVLYARAAAERLGRSRGVMPGRFASSTTGLKSVSSTRSALRFIQQARGAGLLKGVVKFARPIAIGLDVLNIGTATYQYATATTDEQRDAAATKLRGSIGSVAGGAVGAVIGGALGSLLGPGGTVAGAMIGGYLGSVAGEWLGENMTLGGVTRFAGASLAASDKMAKSAARTAKGLYAGMARAFGRGLVDVNKVASGAAKYSPMFRNAAKVSRVFGKALKIVGVAFDAAQIIGGVGKIMKGDDEGYVEAFEGTGSIAGALIGGFLGSALGPVGTVVGAAAGSMLGAWAGRVTGDLYRNNKDIGNFLMTATTMPSVAYGGIAKASFDKSLEVTKGVWGKVSNEAKVGFRHLQNVWENRNQIVDHVKNVHLGYVERAQKQGRAFFENIAKSVLRRTRGGEGMLSQGLAIAKPGIDFGLNLLNGMSGGVASSFNIGFNFVFGGPAMAADAPQQSQYSIEEAQRQAQKVQGKENIFSQMFRAFGNFARAGLNFVKNMLKKPFQAISNFAKWIREQQYNARVAAAQSLQEKTETIENVLEGKRQGAIAKILKGAGFPISSGPRNFKMSQPDLTEFLNLARFEAGGQGDFSLALMMRSAFNRSAMIKSGTVSASTYYAKSGDIMDVIRARNPFNGDAQYSPYDDNKMKNQRVGMNQLQNELRVFNLMQNDQEMFRLGRAAGYTDDQIRRLLGSTNFRNPKDAEDDPSQNYDVIRVRDHVYTKDKFANRVSALNLFNKVYPVQQTANQKDKVAPFNVNELMGGFRELLDVGNQINPLGGSARRPAQALYSGNSRRYTLNDNFNTIQSHHDPYTTEFGTPFDIFLGKDGAHDEDKLYAPKKLKVVYAGPAGTYGNMIELVDPATGKRYLRMAHLSKIAPNIKAGQIVEAGTLLGYEGGTGGGRLTNVHLHLEGQREAVNDFLKTHMTGVFIGGGDPNKPNPFEEAKKLIGPGKFIGPGMQKIIFSNATKGGATKEQIEQVKKSIESYNAQLPEQERQRAASLMAQNKDPNGFTADVIKVLDSVAPGGGSTVVPTGSSGGGGGSTPPASSGGGGGNRGPVSFGTKTGQYLPGGRLTKGDASISRWTNDPDGEKTGMNFFLPGPNQGRGVPLTNPFGVPFRITQVGEDWPGRGEKGFGYYVVGEFTFNGRKYEMLIGHIHDKNIKVGQVIQPGQVIARQGDTGRTPNGAHASTHINPKGNGATIEEALSILRRVGESWRDGRMLDGRTSAPIPSAPTASPPTVTPPAAPPPRSSGGNRPPAATQRTLSTEDSVRSVINQSTFMTWAESKSVYHPFDQDRGFVIYGYEGRLDNTTKAGARTLVNSGVLNKQALTPNVLRFFGAPIPGRQPVVYADSPIAYGPGPLDAKPGMTPNELHNAALRKQKAYRENNIRSLDGWNKYQMDYLQKQGRSAPSPRFIFRRTSTTLQQIKDIKEGKIRLHSSALSDDNPARLNPTVALATGSVLGDRGSVVPRQREFITSPASVAIAAQYTRGQQESKAVVPSEVRAEAARITDAETIAFEEAARKAAQIGNRVEREMASMPRQVVAIARTSEEIVEKASPASTTPVADNRAVTRQIMDRRTAISVTPKDGGVGADVAIRESEELGANAKNILANVSPAAMTKEVAYPLMGLG